MSFNYSQATSCVFSNLDSVENPIYCALMPATFYAVAEDALILPPDQRLPLARQLLDCVYLEPAPGTPFKNTQSAVRG